MKSIRRILRLTLLFLHIIFGIIVTLLYSTILRFDYSKSIYQKTQKWWLRRTCRLLGLNLCVSGNSSEQTVLYIANHISWIDIPLLGGLAPLNFLSKQDVRHWPIIGWLANSAGTLFISRGKQGAAASASQQIQNRLLDKHSVLIFPEGTTTDGTETRRFHGRLLSTAIETKTSVAPIAIRYLNEQGQPNVPLAFINDQSLLDNLWYVIGEKKIRVNVHFFPAISTEGKKRNTLAKECEAMIRQKLKSW